MINQVSKMLSTSSLTSMIASIPNQKKDSEIPLYQRIINAVAEYGFHASSVLEGWQGIDSVPCVTLIYLAYQHVTGKETFVPKSVKKSFMIEIYKAVWEIYKKACDESGLNFVPCINGLTTLCSKRKKLHKS
jgi:hypothetical protein